MEITGIFFDCVCVEGEGVMVGSEWMDPQPETEEFPIVGIGASAGGLEAIEAFFDAMSHDTGAAYVLVQHLSPDFKSLMDEILEKHTRMGIHRVTDNMEVLPNCIYLIPPRKNMVLSNRRLQLSEQAPQKLNMPIDAFLTSLAETAGAQAIGVILSGTGTDGTRGIQAIKEVGGVVLVQDPDTAKFDGMPRSAISTSCADLVLPPSEMPGKIVGYLKRPLNDRDGTPQGMVTYHKILDMILKERQFDFRQYKPLTVTRRIERRIGITQCEDIEQYLSILEKDPGELETLTKEILIGVTCMFRDREAFTVLEEEVIPQLVSKANPLEPLRIWVPACATGEEAFSLAILFDEAIRAKNPELDFKVFATDVDPDSIQRASEGEYHEHIEPQLTEDRLTRYFRRLRNHYEVVRSLREKVLFAQHDLVKDPPFTRMDLVSCRNLLIYFEQGLQARALSLLHFALKADGLLLLGPSESLGRFEGEFECVNSRWKLFRKTRDMRLPIHLHKSDKSPREPRLNLTYVSRSRAQSSPYLMVCQELVKEFSTSVLVLDENKKLIHTLGDIDSYLRIPAGEPTFEIDRVAHDDLRGPIATAFHRSQDQPEVTYTNIRVRISDEECRNVSLTARRIPDTERRSGHYWIVLIREEGTAADVSREEFDTDSHARRRIDVLERELETTRDNLQAVLEEVETTNEELQSANEELIASNEELQSTNEELQSVNEELYTVNAEHHDKIHELTQLAADMEGLLKSTEIGTIFLDPDMKIRKFTPAILGTISLIPADVGRPIGDLSHRFEDVKLLELSKTTAETGKSHELKAMHSDGRWFLLRILPHHYDPGSAAGVVITLIEITEIQKAQESLMKSEELFRQLTENLDEIFWMLTPDGSRVLYCSPQYERIWEQPVAELYQDSSHWLDRIHREDVERVRNARSATEKGFDIEYRVTLPNGKTRWIHERGFPIPDSNGQVHRIGGIARDISSTKKSLHRLEEITRRLETQANKDALTSLLNRRGLEKVLALEVARAVRGGTWLTAILIDVDNFKQINDSLGHAVGDVVLQEISKRITKVLRPVDQLARIGGDEFLALLPDTRLAEAMQVAERVRLVITETPLQVSTREIQVTASLGVNTVGRETISIEEVIARTHRSLSQSKKKGKNRVTSESLSLQNSTGRDESESVILATLSNEECLRAVAQPIHDVVMDKIVGYELLSRGPKGAFEMPNDFFRVCLQNNMLTMIDLKCLKSCVRWATKFIVGGELHLNLFPSTLLDTDIEQLARALSPLEKLDRYCIEISEQQFIGDPSYLRGPVDLLRKKGARIAIDDVGFGRSSLESLIVLEPDVIKIDRSFVNGVDADQERQRNLSRLVHVAEGLGAEVVAEGVETQAELQFVRDTGIRLCQGFLWGAAA